MSRLSEKGIIGCLLIDKNCIDGIATYITEGMFTDELYRAIYVEYLKGYENNEDVDEVTLRWVLGERYPIETLNKEFLECVDSVATSVEIKTHAEIVYKDYQARQANNILQHTPIKGQTAQEDIEKVIGELEKVVEDRRTESHSVAELSKTYKDTYFQEDAEKGVMLGIAALDELVGVLEGGDVIVLGARPAVGKSALMVQIASNMARQGKKIAFYNMEMREKQVYERFVSHLSGLSVTRLRRAIKFNDDEQERFEKANKALQEGYTNIVISSGAKTMSQIRAECKNKDYDVIIIDYLQLIIPESSYKGNRFAEVGEISRKIKGLAMEKDIPIIALSQLNRVSETKETKEPTMGELRESGNVEQDASVIILMWNLDEEKTQKGVKVDKNRQGKTGKIEMTFNGELMRFTSEGEEFQEEWSVDEDAPFN